MTRNYIALACVAVFVVALYWVFNSFYEQNKVLECMNAHRSNCVPLDTSDRGH